MSKDYITPYYFVLCRLMAPISNGLLFSAHPFPEEKMAPCTTEKNEKNDVNVRLLPVYPESPQDLEKFVYSMFLGLLKSFAQSCLCWAFSLHQLGFCKLHMIQYVKKTCISLPPKNSPTIYSRSGSKGTPIHRLAKEQLCYCNIIEIYNL